MILILTSNIVCEFMRRFYIQEMLGFPFESTPQHAIGACCVDSQRGHVITKLTLMERFETTPDTYYVFSYSW